MRRIALFDLYKISCANCSPSIQEDDLPTAAPRITSSYNDVHKLVIQYDESSRNPKWVYEAINSRAVAISNDDVSRKKAKFHSQSDFPNVYRVSHIVNHAFLVTQLRAQRIFTTYIHICTCPYIGNPE